MSAGASEGDDAGGSIAKKETVTRGRQGAAKTAGNGAAGSVHSVVVATSRCACAAPVTGGGPS